jgi:hypothetical protein
MTPTAARDEEQGGDGDGESGRSWRHISPESRAPTSRSGPVCIRRRISTVG